MRRRALLATAGSALLAGCTLPASPPTKVDAASRVQCRDGDTPDNYATFCVGNRTAVAYPEFDAGDALPAVEFASPATADSPAVVTLRLTNDSDEPADVLHLDWWLTPPAASQGDTTLHLLPTADHPLADTDPDVERTTRGHWRAADSPDRDTADTEAVETAVEALDDAGRLPPGETISAPFSLVLGSEAEGFQPGTYQFGHPALVSLTVWKTSSPGPSHDSRFESPSLPADAADARWYHRAGEQTATYLEPSAERVTGSEVRLRLVNHSPHTLAGSQNDWRLYRRTDDGWQRCCQHVVNDFELYVPPGRQREWTFPVAAELPDDPPPLGPGSYAFVTAFSRHDRPHAARFDVGNE